MHSFRLQINDGPIDLKRIATSGQMFRWRWDSDHWLVCDGDHRLKINHSLEVQSNCPQAQVERLFRLETNHAAKLRKILELGPELEPYLDAMSGLRMMRPSSRVETLFSFLCSANNHVSRISSMVWTLASFGGGEFTFPTIERIAAVTEQELRTKGFGYRGATIPVVAEHLLASGGEAYLDDLAKSSYYDARAELISLPGVGPKLADCICLFALDHQESVPIDTHIWQQLTHLYHPEWDGSALTQRKYDHAAESFRDRFGVLAGVAHQFLFVENMHNWRAKAKFNSKAAR